MIALNRLLKDNGKLTRDAPVGDNKDVVGVGGNVESLSPPDTRFCFLYLGGVSRLIGRVDLNLKQCSGFMSLSY